MQQARKEDEAARARLQALPAINFFARLVERDFDVVLQPGTDGRFTVYVPSLDGCLVTASTGEAALDQIVDQIIWFLPTIRELGHHPRPATLDGVHHSDATAHTVRAPDLTKLLRPDRPATPARREDQDFIDAYVALRHARHDTQAPAADDARLLDP